MDLAGRENTESGSLLQTESPLSSGRVASPEPVAMNMPLRMSIESSIGVKVAPQGRGGGGSSGVVRSGSGDLVMVTAGSGSVSGSAGRKKRGRPRKYDSEGNLRIPFLEIGTGSPQPAFTLTSATSSHSQHSSSSKRGRGRLPGSGNWQLLAPLGELFASTAGGDFTPHVVNVYTGEDVAGKILTFTQKGPRGMCVLSANGTISNVTIRQPGSSGGLLTYEGRFEILSLTGSFKISENGGIRSRTGGLSVSLAGPDGRVIGGGVVGLLLAASPIQIVVGSFMPTGYKMTNKRRHNPEPKTGAVSHVVQDVVTEARPVSQATPQSHIFPSPTSDLPVAANGEADNGTSTKHNANSTSNLGADYNGSGHPSYQRETPDINV